MHLNARDAVLFDFLRDYPQVTLATINPTPHGTHITAALARSPLPHPWTRPATFRSIPIHYTQTDPIKTLELRGPTTWPRTAYTACQNEPVALGTQIQPKAKPWIGTAGAPVHWLDAQLGHRYGILTNWHVMPGGNIPRAHTAHQPDQNHPALGALAEWQAVSPSAPNRVDAALLDSLIDGFHTIAPDILDIGELDPTPATADVDLPACKVGRTTGLTCGRCTETGAAVRVHYADFDAIFVDQDVFRADSGDFSAPGDSGSLILCRQMHRPLALLFAGGGALTIGNPIRHVTHSLDFDFRFP